MPRHRPLLAIALLALLAQPLPRCAHALSVADVSAAPDSTMLDRRVAQLAAMVNGAATEPTELFAPSFLTAVPAERMRAMQQLVQQLLPVTSVERRCPSRRWRR